MSSRSTLMITACRSIIRATDRATRASAIGSYHVGVPVLTLQNPHRLVSVSPRIMNVAVPRCQHSPMFGHAASWHTVCRFSDLIRLFSSRYLGPPGAGTLNHGGLRERNGCTSGPRTVNTLAIPPGLALDLVTYPRLATRAKLEHTVSDT